MSESGCLRNESIETLNVNGIILGERRPVKLLVNKGGAGALPSILTAESGTIFLVPALTGGTQTIALPACASSIGCSYTFIMTATAAQILQVQGKGSEKILAVKPKGDGDNTAASQAYDTIGFKAAAVIGSSFKVTCLSATAATAWLAHDVIDGLAANTGCIDLT